MFLGSGSVLELRPSMQEALGWVLNTFQTIGQLKRAWQGPWQAAITANMETSHYKDWEGKAPSGEKPVSRHGCSHPHSNKPFPGPLPCDSVGNIPEATPRFDGQEEWGHYVRTFRAGGEPLWPEVLLLQREKGICPSRPEGRSLL